MRGTRYGARLDFDFPDDKVMCGWFLCGTQDEDRLDMVNEEKIRLMTRLSVYEQGMGIHDDRTAKYFRNDYVFGGMVGSFVTGTIAWMICAAVYCGYFFEQIFFSVYENTLGPLMRFALTSYVTFIAFFLLCTFLVYEGRSAAYTRRRRMYEQDLNALQDMYDRDYQRAAQLYRPGSGSENAKQEAE